MEDSLISWIILLIAVNIGFIYLISAIIKEEEQRKRDDEYEARRNKW